MLHAPHSRTKTKKPRLLYALVRSSNEIQLHLDIASQKKKVILTYSGVYLMKINNQPHKLTYEVTNARTHVCTHKHTDRILCHPVNPLVISSRPQLWKYLPVWPTTIKLVCLWVYLAFRLLICLSEIASAWWLGPATDETVNWLLARHFDLFQPDETARHEN